MSEDTARSAIRVDVRFTQVPEWVLDAEISDRAVRLYGVLGRYADANGRSFPGRETLAERLRCSKDSVDRAMKELEQIGALSKKRRGPHSSLYTLHFVRTGAVSDERVRTGAASRVRTGAAQNESQGNESQGVELEKALSDVPGPRTLNRKTVTNAERSQAWLILAEWNRLAEQDLRAHDWLAKIIGRCREYPNATLEDHTLIIETALAHPWWSGPPTPSVVYGNAAQFERSIQQVRRQRGESDDERLARIVNEGMRRSA